ncbi:MAG: glycosyltransferase [Pseudomonadota bacterium]
MTRLLVLTTTYPRWRGDTEPAFVHNLNKELTAAHGVHVLAPACRGSDSEEVMDNVHIHRFPYLPFGLGTLAYDGGIVPKLKANPLLGWQVPFLFAAMLVASVRITRRYSISVIHAHWVIPQGLIAIVTRKLCPSRPSLLVTSHGADLYSLNGGPLKTLKRWVFTNSHEATVVSRAMARHCRDQLNLNRRIAVEPMGIDCQSVFIDRTPWDQRRGIVFVGRLVEKKGVDLLLRAYATLALDRNTWPLTIVGEGPEAKTLKSLTAELGIENHITFKGAVNAHEVSNLLNQSKICVMPSRIARDGDQEGLGLVAGEAISSGCITIVSNLDAIQDVHNSPTLQFEADDFESLRDRLDFVCHNEAEAREVSADLKRDVVARFDWQAVGARYRNLIAQIITDGNSTSG